MMTQTSDVRYLGIDIGGTTIKAGGFDSCCRLVEKHELATDRTEGGSRILSDIAAYVSRFSGIRGIGLGVPGSVANDGTVNKCVNLGWGVCNPAGILQELSGIPVVAGNDANLAALGEYSVLKDRYSSILFITLGTGVGGGVILDGNMLNGANGAAAEIGHLPIVWDETDRCSCGKVGCLEQAASATGVVKAARRILSTGEASALSAYGELTAKAVFDEAKNGDHVALKVVERAADYLGRGLACAAGMVDPECIVIGGGMAAAGEFLLEKIRSSFRENVFHPCRETSIIQASLGNEAGMYGAAYRAYTR